MECSKERKHFFTKHLLDWNAQHNTRDLPWKNETDPYKIWLSEIILQQTRAEQGLSYYLKFIETYPTVQLLAAAHDEDVFRLWQGLGYYNRCKNLLHTARKITKEFNGRFPSCFDEIIKLKGIGNYTAAAIASFAFHLPHAVVDGNVNRVLARYFGMETAFDTSDGKKLFQSLADELLDKENSASYNQAIMDFGATICTPSNSKCEECPLQKKCIALEKNLISFLPVKSKKTIVKKRYFHYLLLITKNGKIWIRKRTEKDIWQNLYEPLLIEHTSALTVKQLIKHTNLSSIKNASEITYTGMFRQRLTHQLIETRFFTTSIENEMNIQDNEGAWTALSELKKIAFPKTLVSFLQKKFYF